MTQAHFPPRKSQQDNAVPSVSVIVLNYNGRPDLGPCLESLARLDYPRDMIEIIVVDNASIDGSADWVRETHPGVRLIVNPNNLGFAGGIQSGVLAATGEYLAFLNADMRVDPAWLQALVETVRREPGVVCAGSLILDWEGSHIDYAGRPQDALNLCPEPPTEAAQLLRTGGDIPLLFASGGAMLIERGVFLAQGGFDPDYFLYHEDVDLGWRLWISGYRVIRSTASIAYHHGGRSARAMPQTQIMRMAQKYALYTALKNLQHDLLGEVLPGIVWYLVERTTWWEDCRVSLPEAIEEVANEIRAVWRKRATIQSGRERSDPHIFAECGDPFGFLARNLKYAGFVRELSRRESGLRAPIRDAQQAAERMRRLLALAYDYNRKTQGREAVLSASPCRPIPSPAEQAPTGRGVADVVERTARRLLPPRMRKLLAPAWYWLRRRVRGDRRPWPLRELAADQTQSMPGRCTVCGAAVNFILLPEAGHRESLTCSECHATSRYRSIAVGVLRAVRELTGIDSPSVAELPKVRRGARLCVYDTQPAFWAERCAYPVPSLLAQCDWIDMRTSIYDPRRPWGEAVNSKTTNQNLEQLTFRDGEFDIVITSDVMEHVRLAYQALREIRRVLRPSGVYLMTVPHERERQATLERVTIVDPLDPSQDRYPLPREYHGDANSITGRSLVYRMYGTQLDDELQSLGFTVDYSHEDRPELGIVDTELFYCRVSPIG